LRLAHKHGISAVACLSALDAQPPEFVAALIDSDAAGVGISFLF